MVKNIYAECIYEFEDFLSVEEQTTILSLIESSGDIWNNGSEGYWKDKNARLDHEVMRSIDQRVKSMFHNATHINTIDAVNRFRSGDEMGIHSDEIGNSEIQYGVVIYINDDFNCGEISYPTLNIVHKPKARSLIIHPGSLPHLVNKVCDGPTRYSITTFVHGSKELPVVIK